MKHFNFDDVTHVDLAYTSISEMKLLAGSTLELDMTVFLSISKDCLLTLEDFLKAKQAFRRSLYRSMEKK